MKYYAILEVATEFFLQILKEGGLRGTPIDRPLPDDVIVSGARTDGRTLYLTLTTQMPGYFPEIREGDRIPTIMGPTFKSFETWPHAGTIAADTKNPHIRSDYPMQVAEMYPEVGKKEMFGNWPPDA